MGIDWSWAWLTDFSELWAALVGALIASGVSLLAERNRSAAAARQEWRRIQDTDLREFQTAAVAAVHALDGDLKRTWNQYVSPESGAPTLWGSVDSLAAYAVVEMLSTRLESEYVKDAFAAVARSIEEAHAELSRLPTPNPFVGLLTVETSGDEQLSPQQRLSKATWSAVSARQRLTALQKACADAYAENRQSH